MTAGVTTQLQLPLQAVEMGLLPPGLADSTEAISSLQTIPVKRNPDDEVQFVSSHPVKKPRLRNDEEGAHQKLAQVQPNPLLHQSQSLARNQANTPRHEVLVVRNDRTSLDKHAGSEPRGLAAHLLSHAMWQTRGTSFPSLENFSFQTAYSSSGRPADSVAVSPKHLPQESSINQEQTQPSHGTHATATPGAIMDQVHNLGAPGHQGSEVQPNFTTMAVNQASRHSIGKGGALAERLTIPNLIVPVAVSSAICTPNTAQHGQACPTSLSAPCHTHMNYLSSSAMPPSYNPAGVNVAHSQVQIQSPGIDQPRQPSFRAEQATTAAHLNPGPIARDQHVFNQHLALESTGMTAPVFSPSSLANTHSKPIRRGPCPGCIAARQIVCRGQTLGLHHGHLGIRGHEPGLNRQLQASIGDPSFHQPHQLSSPPMTSLGSTPNPNPAYFLPPGLKWPVQGTISSGTTPTLASGERPPAAGGAIVPLPQRSHYPGDANTPEPSSEQPHPSTLPPHNMNTPECLMQPLGTLQSLQSNTKQPPDYPSHPNTAHKLPQTPLTPVHNQNTLPLQPDQPCLPNPHPQPLSIPAATSHAAAHVLNRPKNQHAQNLLVDVAETATEIFPYELIARRHGCATFKVVEALAAVVQVPLLRCATDKRRAGKLGAERVKEIKEMRKGWAAREREQERLRREKERRGEVSDGGARGGEGSRGMGKGGGRVGESETSNAPRSVFVSLGPGQPSALDVAQMLGPMDMPDVLRGNGVFAVQWQ